ncbi:MAG: NfeD family protein [Acidimicrobiales bacterium]|jgi:membrane-bound ClpP family serine protease
MTDANFRSPYPAGQFNNKASAVTSTGAPRSADPILADLRHMAVARRIFVTAVMSAFGLLAVAVLVVSLLAPGALPWMVGAVLALAVVGVIVLGVHAGGHGWFVPLPVLVLAAAWAVAVSAGTWRSPAAWVFAALAFLGAVPAAALVLPAIAYRRATFAPRGAAALPGSDGVAVTALAPTGIARVNNETWTARSVSGPLPAGAPVHVVSVEGVRLLVWSEAGDIPGPDALGLNNQEKE